MPPKNKAKKIVSNGVYLTEPSSTRDMTHSLYSGDIANPPSCTCENYRYGMRVLDVLFTCKHIDKAVYGIERSKA